MASFDGEDGMEVFEIPLKHFGSSSEAAAPVSLNNELERFTRLGHRWHSKIYSNFEYFLAMGLTSTFQMAKKPSRYTHCIYLGVLFGRIFHVIVRIVGRHGAAVALCNHNSRNPAQYKMVQKDGAERMNHYFRSLQYIYTQVIKKSIRRLNENFKLKS